MEADWEEVSRVVVPPLLPGLPSSSASVVAFDDTQELLWVANDQGRLSAFHGADLQYYVSTIAHDAEGPIRQILFHEEGVITLASRSIHFTSRRGRSLWHSHHSSMIDLRCMTFTNNRNQILIAGSQHLMLVIELAHGDIIEEHPAQANYTLMKKARHICAATDNGEIAILNATNFKVLKTWEGHGGAISDLDARGDFLVTCGHSRRAMGQSLMDPLAKVYDLKTLSTLPPLPFHAGAAYVCLHPRLQTTSFIASQTGQLQVVDLMNPNSINLRQLSLQYMLGMALAPTGNALAIIDAEGAIHLWGSRSKIRFSTQQQETEFAHPVSETPFVDWRDGPLNSIGMPYYNEPLLSAWPSHWHFDIGAPPPPIDPQLSLAPSDMGYYAPNTKSTFRYQVEDTRATVMGTTMAAPKFLSEKAKDSNKNLERRLSKAAQLLADTTLDSAVAQEGQLAKYSNVEIKYSRFGVDDFDFRYYNQTQFSGLETHIANSFINALLQLYRFIPLVRNLSLHHASTSCKASACLLCELGFLTDMLEKAAGQNCQATNLLRAFSSLPEALTLGLVEERALNSGNSLSSTIQSINRFMMKQIAQDSKDLTGTTDEVDEVFATTALESIRCMYCYNEITRPSTSYVLDLVYPANSPAIDPKILLRNPMYRFSSILQASIERESKSRGWCNKCRRYQQLSLRKTVQSLPLTLMVNAALGDLSLHSLWEVPGWLPTEIGIVMHANGTFSCFQGKELELEVRRNTPNLLVYDLVGLVAEIDIPEHQRPHLVSCVNVAVSSEGQQQPEANWHLFNDFLVSPITTNEALAFKQEFKTPSVLAFQIQSARGAIDHSWKGNLNTSLLFDPYDINGGDVTPELKMLLLSEEPMEGTPIALDTEFVDLQRAEIDVKADGTQETIRPAKSGLARVSVLRGAGEFEGAPFIDDWITIPETSIVDYKTQYSGIRPGDLDPLTSVHNLVPLKLAYKKLWLLLNLGCIFVGHGLASDFRKINIQVPKHQTVDTQYLYLEPGKNRRFSLRYLAWAVFKEYIQEESHEEFPAGHDSIEDARMALRLWRKFQQWQAAGTVEQMVDEIYRKGFRYQWKPPARDGSMTGVNSAAASGRNTPEVGGGSGPTTPARGLRFSGGVPAFAPRAEDRGFGSPLR